MKMLFRYKILLLPLIVFCFAGYSLLNEKPIKLEKTTFSRGFPFPPNKESKTEYTKASWSNKVSKSFSPFICSLTKNKMGRPSVYIISFNEQKFFYSSNYFNKHNDRAPPFLLT